MEIRIIIVSAITTTMLSGCTLVEDVGKITEGVGRAIKNTARERQGTNHRGSGGQNSHEKSENISSGANDRGDDKSSGRNSKTRVGSKNTAATRPEYSAEVQQAQNLLNILGYRAGAEDGLMGKKTREAIRLFQKDRNLPMSSKADAATLTSLRESAKEIQKDSTVSSPSVEKTISDNKEANRTKKEKGGGSTTKVEQNNANGSNQDNIEEILPNPKNESNAPEDKNASVRVISSTELKREPDPFSETISNLVSGQEVIVIRRSGEWAQVQHENKQGFVFSEFLK